MGRLTRFIEAVTQPEDDDDFEGEENGWNDDDAFEFDDDNDNDGVEHDSNQEGWEEEEDLFTEEGEETIQSQSQLGSSGWEDSLDTRDLSMKEDDHIQTFADTTFATDDAYITRSEPLNDTINTTQQDEDTSRSNYRRSVSFDASLGDVAAPPRWGGRTSSSTASVARQSSARSLVCASSRSSVRTPASRV